MYIDNKTNNKIVYAIKDSISNLEQEQNKLERQKTFLKNMDITKSLSEKEWTYLCETPLCFDSDTLCMLAQKIFPEGTNFEYKESYIHFDLYGLECMLPTSNTPGIKVDLSWTIEQLNNDPQKEEDNRNKEEKLINDVFPVLSRYTDNISNFYEYPRYTIEQIIHIRNFYDKENMELE